MLTRRQILARAGLATPMAMVATRGAWLGSMAFGSPITADDLGVASGEPTPSSILLWTKIPGAFRPGAGDIDVSCVVATSQGFEPSTIVARQTSRASGTSDYCVRTKVEGLEAGTRYYYRFTTDTGYTSVTGRTKTAPAADSTAPVRFAVVSCQDYTQGYFLSYQAIAAGDFDFVLHLGDFIYEKAHGSPVRPDTIGGGEATTLEHYRAKYQLYLTDPYLKEARRLFPFVHLWDDHEVVNNYAGPTLAGTTPDRMAGGYQAFFEYNPVPAILTRRNGIPSASMHRALRFGQNLELFAMDQRQFRDPVLCGRDMVVQRCAEVMAPSRTMLGNSQQQWLTQYIGQSGASWKLLASELMMMPVRTPNVPIFVSGRDSQVTSTADNTFLTLDSWDGYPAERQRVLSALTQAQVKDVVVCSGDIHNFFGGVIHQNPDDAESAAVAVELTTGSITSKGISEWLGSAGTAIIRPGIQSRNAHLKFFDLKSHGHIEMEVTTDALSGRMVAYDNVRITTGRPFVLKQFGVRRGTADLTLS